MPVFVALLRAVNVGGYGKLSMADLRALLEKLGYTRVETYIQSGNAPFPRANSIDRCLAWGQELGSMNPQAYWDKIYAHKAPDQVSWYRPHLEESLALIGQAGAGRSASIIDVGGGESTLVDDLLACGYSNLTVLDVSQTAVTATRKRLGEAAAGVRWLVADITRAELEPSTYDVWHDRAVFHFLTSEAERRAYVRQVAHAVKRGGHVIISAFGPEGPTRCSGLEVVRYDAESLHAEFGESFRLISSSRHLHETPFGTTQQFLYCHCIVQ